MADAVELCGCEDVVNVFLNPWGLSQRSIQHSNEHCRAHTPPPGKTKKKRLPFCSLRLSEGNEGVVSANQLARLIMLMLLSLLLISYGVGNIRCSTVPGNRTDMLSLLDFKAVTNDPTKALSSWNSSIPHCQWKGVNCSLTHQGRVTALNLTGQNLQGQIAPSLGNLTFLRILDLTSNGFFGPRPFCQLDNRHHPIEPAKHHPTKQFPKVSYKDLAEATQNFAESNLVGRGGYGSVYRGKLTQDNLEVAVKVHDLDMRGAEKSFLSEWETLRGIRHRNLVPIRTACSTVDLKGNVFKALVYEFMPNGNLDTWLHHKEDGKATKALDLTQRTCFAVNIADALDYLHNESGRTIIHCDVKPSNILLDDDMNAHLGDFGIANFYRDSKSTSTGDTSSIGVKGTVGYIAPEYARGGRASTCGDVYSFGIVLLEMVTGKRPTDPSFVNELNIVSFVERNFPDQILHVIDTPLQAECKAITEANMVTENGAYH